MKRKPKRIFRERRTPGGIKTLHVGPEHYHRPNYEAKCDALADELARTGQLKPGVRIMEIRHDDDCAHWQGRGCNCDPEVRMGEP